MKNPDPDHESELDPVLEAMRERITTRIAGFKSPGDDTVPAGQPDPLDELHVRVHSHMSKPVPPPNLYADGSPVPPMRSIPPKPTIPPNLRLPEDGSGTKPSGHVWRTVAIMAIIGCAYGVMFGILSLRATREAQAELATTKAAQTTNLEEAKAAQLRATQAEARVVYLEQLLKKFFNLEPK